MDYAKFLAATTYSGEELLNDWHWLMPAHLRLWHVTKTGDALLRDPVDGSIHLLDTSRGKVQRIAANESEFESLLNVSANQKRWLMTEIVNGQAMLGMRPAANQCLSFKQPLALGGELDPDNLEVIDIAVHFSISGQIHRQIKDIPPGEPIHQIRIEQPRSDRHRPWWRFW